MQRMKTWTKRLARWTGNVAIVAVILACAAYLLPHFMGYERYVITGGSMSGTIEKGSVVFAKPVPVEDLAVGDVITYMPPADSGIHNLVTHRLVEIEQGDTGQLVMRTKGDAVPHVDPWTFSLVEDVQPVVEYTVPTLGYLLIALADREMRMLIIGVPAALIALLALIELSRNALGAWSERDHRSSTSDRPAHAGSGSSGHR
jgi:signal peptidase I